MADFGRTVTIDCAPLCNEDHDLKQEYRENLNYVNNDKTAQNTVFEYRTLEDVYQEQFGAAIDKHNARQNRDDRKKTVEGYKNELEDNVKKYMKLSPEERKKDNSVKSRYEILIYIGDSKDTGYKNNPEAAKLAEEVQKEYIEGFKKRNPNLVVQYAYQHKDEATPHGGIVFVPVADGYKKGMEKRVSMNKALEQQGFPDKRGETGYDRWIKGEREELKRLAKAKGLEIIEKNDPKRQKLTRSEYISQQNALQAELAKEPPLKKLDKAKPNVLGYVPGESYERLYSEYLKLGDRCWKAEKLVKDTAAMDKQKLSADNKELSQGVDDLLAAVDEKERALGKSRALTRQAAGAFKIAVGVLSESQAKYVTQTLEKAGYNEKLTKVAGERLKECQRIKSHQQSQQGSLDLSEAKKKLEKTVGKVLKR